MVRTTRKMRGGKFNSVEKSKLKRTLKKIWKKTNTPLTREKFAEIMIELDKGSQLFSGSKLKQLRSQITPLNNEQFAIWLRDIYPLFAEDVETDYESYGSSVYSNSTNMSSTSLS
jgi:hypothetical protein